MNNSEKITIEESILLEAYQKHKEICAEYNRKPMNYDKFCKDVIEKGISQINGYIKKGQEITGKGNKNKLRNRKKY